MARRLILILHIAAVMLMASPAPAVVHLNCADLGNGVVELSYDANEEAVPVRVFALDIEVNNGVILTARFVNPHYWVVPGEIEIGHDECGSLPTCYLSTPAGLNSSHLLVEVGALYVGEANAPPLSGPLLEFTVSALCDVSISENALRGGVVLEDLSQPGIDAPGISDVQPGPVGTYGGGSGTANDPYLIAEPQHLNAIGQHPGDWCKHFKLVADLDLSVYSADEFNIIGTSFGHAFSGTFDGNNCAIYNFTYTSDDANFVGLFGCVNGAGALIKNLLIVDPNISIQSGFYTGSLVGCLGDGTISACCTDGGSVSAYRFVGGLVGWNDEGTIENCCSTTSVQGQCSVGGLVGKGYDTVLNSYSAGSVYADANLAGGFAGYNDGTMSASFWDEQTSGQPDPTGSDGEHAVTDVNGKTTEQMQTKDTFTSAGWDFKGESDNGTQDTWTISEGQTYPALVRRRFIGDFIGLDGVDMADFSVLALAWRCTDSDPNWSSFSVCDISDPNDGVIDERDLSVFADNWLAHSR
jgi:hypothetical protein